MTGDEAAFPSVAKEYFSDEIGGNWCDVRNPGLTKREWLAGLAMQGLLASIEDFRKGAMYHPEDVSELSVQYADALLAELAKPTAEALNKLPSEGGKSEV